MELKKGLPDRNGVKAVYKLTEVGVIPDNWNVIPIGKIFEFKNGLNKAKGYFGKGTPIVNYMDVFNNPGIFEQDVEGKVTLTADEIRNYQVKQGDVFFTRTSETVDEIGMSSALLENITDAVFSGFVLRGRPKNDILDLLYKQYCFRAKEVRKQICSTSSYTTRALTNGKLLSNVYIPVPPTKTEQTAIASALSDADALIQSLEKLIAKKRLIKQGAMQELLKPKEGWVVKKLGEIGIFKKGKGIKKDEVSTEGYPCIRYGELYTHHDEYIKLFNSFINEQTAKESQRINKGDILFAGSGETKEEIGKCAAFVDERIAYAGGDVIILTPIDCDSMFLGFLLNHSMVAKQKAQKAQGDAIVHIYPSSLSEISIHLPQKSKQTRIATILSDMDAEISALETKLAKYKQVKQGMMQNLLTGKIRLV